VLEELKRIEAIAKIEFPDALKIQYKKSMPMSIMPPDRLVN